MSITAHQFMVEIESAAKAAQLPTELSDTPDILALNIGRGTFISLAIEFDKEENIGNIWAYVRTSSADFDGDRTDLHESISTIFAVFLRLFCNISCSLWDVPNGFSRIETEIYARMISFDQPYRHGFMINEVELEKMKKILFHLCFFNFRFWSLFECLCPNCKEYKPGEKIPQLYDYTKAESWADEIQLISGSTSDEYQYNARYSPVWKHYRNITSGISIFEAQNLSQYLNRMVQIALKWETIDGINSKLLITENTCNAIPYASIQRVENILKALKIGSEDSITVIPLENCLVVAGGENIAFVLQDCGRQRFDEDKERVRQRHLKEAKLLFPVSSFSWQKGIDGDEFELFVRDLLATEVGVKRVRKVSLGTERDNGKDLIADWLTPPLPGETIQDEKSPYIDRKILVQCKASNSSLGKNKVTDIGDTIEFHDAGGYLLVVSSFLSTTLTDHLEKLRRKGKYWIDWWTRSEIEERLRSNPQIVARYPNIVRISES